MMLCQMCQSSQEVLDSVINTAIDKISLANHFHVKSNLLEVVGLCQKCYKIAKKTKALTS